MPNRPLRVSSRQVLAAALAAGLMPTAAALAQANPPAPEDASPPATPRPAPRSAPAAPNAEPANAPPPTTNATPVSGDTPSSNDAAAPETAQPLPSEATPAAAGADAELEREIADELARSATRTPQTTPSAPPSPAARTTLSASGAGGPSNALNPSISATAVMYAGGATHRSSASVDTGELRNGLALQEAELRFSAIVDPYLRADVMLAGDLDHVAFEEAYLSTLSLPRVTIRAGQLPAAFGRHNPLHTHAYPFLTAPLPWRALLGPDGLRDPGVSADVLLPLPFYAEVNAQAFRGQWRPFERPAASTALPGAGTDLRHEQDLAYLGHLKLLFELGEPTTLELGGTFLGGRNAFGGLTQVAGADLTLKWRPLAAERYTGVDWTTEYLWVDRGAALVERRRGGGYTAVRYQFAQRFWVQARGALLGLPQDEQGRSTRAEALLAFVPSEFSAFRLQYAFEPVHRGAPLPIHEVFLQAIVSIGAHPAHAY